MNKHPRTSKTILKTVFFILLFIIFAYLLFPLKSKKWDISFKDEDLQAKRRFLEELKPSKNQSPNIIIISADDLAQTDISHYGSPFISTPHMDSIGEEGVTFTQGLASAPVSSPSRAGLLTGRYQNRFGVDSQPMRIYPMNRMIFYITKYFINTDAMSPVLYKNYPRKEQMLKQGLPPTEITLAEILKKGGYRTSFIGKWHLGYDDSNQPQRFGFDEQYGFSEAFSLFADEDDPEIINYRHDLFSNKHIWRQQRKGPCAITRNGEIINEKRYLTDAIAQEGRDFIHRSSEQSPSPFFLYLSFNAPHTPFQATKKYYNQFSHIKDENKRVYLAMIKQLDDAVGSILQTLDDHELSDNTLIFFISDNGGATYTEATDNAPWKGGKFSQFEGGILTPFMIKWPGAIPGGIVYDPSVSHLDIYSTALAAAGMSAPLDRIIDGKDLLPYITGEEQEFPHKRLYWRCDYSLCIRTNDWKLILNNQTGERELYKMSEERSEKEDVQNLYSDVADDLEKSLLEWNDSLPDPSWPRVMDYHFKIDGKDYTFAI